MTGALIVVVVLGLVALAFREVLSYRAQQRAIRRGFCERDAAEVLYPPARRRERFDVAPVRPPAAPFNEAHPRELVRGPVGARKEQVFDGDSTG